MTFSAGTPGREARLCYAGHAEMDNRHGLVVIARLTQAAGNAESEAARRAHVRDRSRR